MKVKLKATENIKVHLKPKQSIKLRNKNVYVYDPNIIGEYVALAEDWAKKTDGLVDETDYSSKAWAIGGEGTETNNSKYYAEQASDSASAAATSETNASASELNAQGYAANAYTSETNAQGYAQTAVNKADAAATSAGEATAQAVIAKGHADNAADSATTATTQAGIATTQAGNASASASAAAISAASAANSAIWAEGTDEQVQEIGGTHSAKGWVNTLGTIYKPAGSVAFENLPALSSDREGYVYNVNNAFTTTSDFVDGAGKSYPAGTNVVCIDVGSSVYKWDVLSGFVDLSSYRTAVAQDAIDATKASASDVSAIQANYVTTNTAQTISGNKTFSGNFVNSNDTERILVLKNTTADALTTPESTLYTGTISTRDKNDKHVTNIRSALLTNGTQLSYNVRNYSEGNKHIQSLFRATTYSDGGGDMSFAVNNNGSGDTRTATNRCLSTATSSTTEGRLACQGWVNNPSTSTNVVHRSGGEAITGQKEFRGGIKINNTGSATYAMLNQLSNGKVDLYCIGSDGNWSQNYIEMNPSYETVVRGATNVQLLGTTPATTNQSPTEDTTTSKQIDTVGARNTKINSYVSLAGTETITGNKDFTGTVTAVTQTAGDNSTKVATTAYVDSLVGAVHIVETWHNGTEWGRVWSDKFCEQGGTVGTGTTSGYPSYTIQLTKEYADTNFNVQVTGRYTNSTNDGTNYCSARTTNSITIRSVGYGSDWVTRGYIS